MSTAKTQSKLFGNTVGLLLMLAVIFFYSQWKFPEILALTPSQNDPVASRPPLISPDDLLLNKAMLVDLAGQNRQTFLDAELMFRVDNGQSVAGNTRVSLQEIYQMLVHHQESPDSGVRIIEVVDVAAHARTIDTVLQQADDFYIQDKLTTPRIDNAFSRYEDVLSMQPGNTRALAGIDNIIERYGFFIESVIARKQISKLPALLEAVIIVGRKYRDLTPFVEQYRQYLSDEQIADLALLQGHPYSGEYRFDQPQLLASESEFLSVVAPTKLALDVLLQEYLARGQLAMAEALVLDSNELDAQHTAEKVARIFIARRDYKEAFELLLSHQPLTIRDNPGYFYLLAGLQLKMGDAEKAAGLYRNLLALDRHNSYYWFGLAVVLEAVNDNRASLVYRVAHRLAAEKSLLSLYFEQGLPQHKPHVNS